MERPLISNYNDIPSFLSAMLRYLKKHAGGFSVLQEAKRLRRVSPALVSLLVSGKRQLTRDRAPEIAKLLRLTAHERRYLIDWIDRGETTAPLPSQEHPTGKNIRVTTSHILNDWLNVYVKDAFQLTHISRNPSLIYSALGGIASRSRIDKSIAFLIKNGYLKHLEDGRMVPESPLHVVDQQISDAKVQAFHKQALRAAATAIDLHSLEKRIANAVILPLNKESYEELKDIITEFSDRLQTFATKQKTGHQLYQILINLSPTGGLDD